MIFFFSSIDFLKTIIRLDVIGWCVEMISVKVNPNLEKLPPYLFAEMDRKKKEIQQKIEDGEGKFESFIPLTIGDPDIPTPWPIIEKLQRYAEDYHGYPDYEGTRELREALTDYYRRRANVTLSPDDFVICAGAKNELFDQTRVFTRIGRNPPDILLLN